MRTVVRSLVTITLALGAAGTAVAQVAGAVEEARDPVAEKDADPEAELDAGLRRFGYLAGLARGCVTEKQRDLLEREAIDIHAGITRLMGSDRAFLFAAAYGYGTNIEVETKDCAEVIKTYDDRVAKHRANTGGAR